MSSGPIHPPTRAQSPGWLGKISPLDEKRVVLIARVLNQAGNFNEVVREQIRGMQIGNLYISAQLFTPRLWAHKPS
jgi:hypothetical protein